jgi:hypothetical protein
MEPSPRIGDACVFVFMTKQTVTEANKENAKIIEMKPFVAAEIILEYFKSHFFMRELASYFIIS